jgi:hypothetical protein
MMTMRTRFSALAAAALGSIVLSLPAVAQAPSGDLAPPPPPPDDEQADVNAPPTDAEPTPPAAAGPPAQAPSMQTFERELGPYGRWVDTPEYGRVWIPSGVGPDWQPYSDGRWVETAWGWSFVSYVPWGSPVFHYGRWGWRGGLGWFWTPGFVWAPAWVSWRYYNGYVCWSPFAPAGFVYPRAWRGWVVVPSHAFLRPLRPHIIPFSTASRIVRFARPAPSIGRVPSRGLFYGPPRTVIGPRRRALPPRAVERRRRR